jgi:hypothetical protein
MSNSSVVVRFISILRLFILGRERRGSVDLIQVENANYLRDVDGVPADRALMEKDQSNR